MTQRWRRKAVEMEAQQFTGEPIPGVCMGNCLDWFSSEPHNHVHHAVVEPGDWIVNNEHVHSWEFERDYEPVPSDGDVSRACMICEQTAKSLQLADKITHAFHDYLEGVADLEDVETAVREYLESRGNK